MNYTSVWAPRSLLLDCRLPAEARLAWLVAMLPVRPDIRRTPANRVAALAERSGLSLPTVRKSLRQLADAGWISRDGLPVNRARHDVGTDVPRDLLLESAIGAEAKILWCVLQLIRGGIKFAALQRTTGRCVNAIKQTVAELGQSGWITAEQESRVQPVYFSLHNPVHALRDTAVDRARLRIDTAPSTGEGLMREWLSLLVDSIDYQDGATYGFLVNPRTGMPMQFDRFYPPGVAFEFHGPQHFGPTEKFTAKESAEQQARDLMKLGICVTRGITPVVVVADDLSLEGMRRKVGQLLPLRHLTENELLLDYLESRSTQYRQSPR